jgi:hypothetical protein
MSINGNSDAFYFGFATTAAYLYGADEKTVKLYGGIGFIKEIAFRPLNNFRDTILTLIKASSTALSIVTGIIAGAGLNKIFEGENTAEATKETAAATLTYMVGTVALRNFGRYIAK